MAAAVRDIAEQPDMVGRRAIAGVEAQREAVRGIDRPRHPVDCDEAGIFALVALGVLGNRPHLGLGCVHRLVESGLGLAGRQPLGHRHQPLQLVDVGVRLGCGLGDHGHDRAGVGGNDMGVVGGL